LASIFRVNNSLAATWSDADHQVWSTAKRLSCQSLVRALINIETIAAAAFAPLIFGHVRLAVVESRPGRAGINNLHCDAITDTADRSTIVAAFVADLEAFATRGRRACRALISRHRTLAIAVTHSQRKSRTISTAKSLPLGIVDAARALGSRPDVWAKIADGCPVCSTSAILGAADGVALGSVIVESGNTGVCRALIQDSVCMRDRRQNGEPDRLSVHFDLQANLGVY
jgi:hypothetical protein